MKAIFLLPVLALAGATLAGCQSEQQLQTAFRDQLASQCRQQFRAGSMGPVTADQFCGCFVNKVTNGKTSEQLRNMPPSEAENAGAQCAMEALGAATNSAAPAAPTAPAPAGNTAEPAETE